MNIFSAIAVCGLCPIVLGAVMTWRIRVMTAGPKSIRMMCGECDRLAMDGRAGELRPHRAVKSNREIIFVDYQDQDQILEEAVAIVCSQPALSNADLIDIVIETTGTTYAIAEQAVAKAIKKNSIPPVSSCEKANSSTTEEPDNNFTISVNGFVIAITYFILIIVGVNIVTNFIIGGSITDLIQELSKEEKR